MESIKSSKFAPLTARQARMVLGGGTKTEGRAYTTDIVEVYERDGQMYQRQQVKSYTADEKDGRDTCYTDLEYCWGPESPYNPPR